MKYTLIIILISSIIQSCQESEDISVKARYSQFEIKNESNKDVTIFLYRRNNDLFKSIIVNAGDSVIMDEGNETPPNTPTFSLTVSIDSAVILFSDNKRLTQTTGDRGNNDIINNILDRSFYYDINKKNRFTLKESDYLRSQ
jgi:hypothetical protein